MSLTNGIKLKELLNGTFMEVSFFIHIAKALAELVRTAHKRDTVIGDLNPASIRIQLEKNVAVLTEIVKPDYAYISPEQTGRINRTPDMRSDLYALGVIYYEMLAGNLPFQAHNAEDWMHAHIAIVPRPLRELRPEMAGPLGDIIMKLLSKTPEERYQSAYGLLSDLERCVTSLEERGGIVPFEIARTDEASRFRLPRSLFGRDTEEEELRGAFELARMGATSFVFVTGRAGIGKTALIRELQGSITREGGQFIAGKCDLMNRDTPFSPILQSLRRLIRQIWSESPHRVAKLKDELAEALGQGAGVIAELLPEAAKLLGDLPSVEQLPPAEAAIRFRRLLPIFIKIFAGREHPLVMFLDDLQWADPATLDILRAFAQDPTIQGLLIIGAYRSEAASGWTDNGEDHAAAALWIEHALSLHKLETPPRVRHIALDPLSYVDVRRIASFIFNENTARIRLLAESLYHRTGGNPFYLHRLLDSLYREKKFYFDEQQAIWSWDAAVIKQIPEDPDVLHLIGTRLRMLPHETFGLLAIAAAIGHRFRLATIALVSEHSLPDTLKLLRSAEEEGLIWREDDSNDAEKDDGFYTFLHDRVQQAAYALVPESDLAGLHLRIGRIMLQNGSGQKDESIFDMVYHMNLGCGEMVDEAERRELAVYNLQAGLKSKASTAFAAAQHFLETGLRLLGDDEAGTDSLAYRLMLELPECEYMCGRTDRAEELFERLMTRTTDLVERSNIYLIQIAMNAYLKRDDLAVNIGLQALTEFGWEIPNRPSKAAMVRELLKTQLALYRMRNKLPHLPVNRDPLYKALSDLVMAMSASAFVINPELTAVLYPRFVRYGLKHGSNEAFAFMLGAYGMILGFGFPRNVAGFRFIETAYLLSSFFENTALKCRLHFIMGLSEQYRSSEKAVEHFEQSVGYGLEAADLTFVGFSMGLSIINHTGDLRTLSARVAYYEETSRQLLDDVTLKLFRIVRWHVAELQGDANEIDEVIAAIEGNRFNNNTHNNQAFYICSCKIEIAYLAGRYREALEWVERARSFDSQQTPLLVRKQHIYQALSLSALYAEVPQEERKGIRAMLNKQLLSKQRFGYFGRKSSAYLLIMAELQQIDGNRVDAAKAFEEAIAAARKEEYSVIEAIACERASIYYRETGIVTAADALLADACAAYSRWGATAKVRKLREAYPHLPLSAFSSQEDTMTATGGSIEIDSGQPRKKANQWITPEDNHDKTPREMVPYRDDEKLLIRQIVGWSGAVDSRDLMNRFLDAALRYSGAEKGYVLNNLGEVFSIEDQVGSMNDKPEDATYAEAIVRYVICTGESVVLADASRSSYAADSYIRRCHPQSILCMPVLFPGKLPPSVLYLENNLISGVFTKEKLEVLDIMITRMVYLKSLEDSRTRESESSDSSHSPSAFSTKASQPLLDPLTNRETEILYALSDGLSNKEIAYRFGLTEGTVKSHVFRLYGKLGVKRRGQAIAQARELQLIV